MEEKSQDSLLKEEIIELGEATKLTLGADGSWAEGYYYPRPYLKP